VHKEDTPCFLVNIPIMINAYFINNVNFALKHRMEEENKCVGVFCKMTKFDSYIYVPMHLKKR
jgi:hypothetical protein